MFIKAGDSEIREGLKVEAAAGERKKKRVLETGSGDWPRMSYRCPLLPWLQVLWGPLERRRKAAGI